MTALDRLDENIAQIVIWLNNNKVIVGGQKKCLIIIIDKIIKAETLSAEEQKGIKTVIDIRQLLPDFKEISNELNYDFTHLLTWLNENPNCILPEKVKNRLTNILKRINELETTNS